MALGERRQRRRLSWARAIWYVQRKKEAIMGINTESDITANLQIGPTTDGMVRIFVEAGDVEIPMDFEPEEALDIAEEIRAAALSITGE